MLDKMTIKFLGAAGTVTGSKYLLETSKKKAYGGLWGIPGFERIAVA